MDAESTFNFISEAVLVHVLVALLFVGVGYAFLVRRLRRRHADHGQTAWLVVVGDLIVAVGFAVIAGVNSAIVLLLCMAAAGIPMIVEYVDDHLRNQERKGGLDL